MIPKIIHYCWFGGSPKSDIIEKCIASWRKLCPDYEIIEWNEKNWDIEEYQYAKEAYEKKAWAFVSDIARLDVLNKYGGIYIDTDVEILEKEPFDKYLMFESVLCFENIRSINTGMIYACEKDTFMTKRLLHPYLQTHYSSENFIVNTKMNKPVIQSLFPELRWNGSTQVLNRTCFIGCEEYSRVMKHYSVKSWADLPTYSINNSSTWLKRIMRNPEIFEKLENSSFGRKALPVYTFLAYDLQDLGVFYFIRLRIHKYMKKWRKHKNEKTEINKSTKR